MAKKPEKLDCWDRLWAGDESALPEFVERLKRHPEVIERFIRTPEQCLLGKIARMTTDAITEKHPGGPLVWKTVLAAKLDSLRAELAGPQPGEVERLLVERVVASWLQVYYADLCYGRENSTLVQDTHVQRRLDRAHRRFLSAVKMLATVRRLALPIRVDLNVAGTVKTSDTAATALDRFRLSAGRNN